MEFSKKDTLKIKGIAILMVYWHHFYMSEDRFEQYNLSFFPLTQYRTVYIANALKICVALFVFLTGYGMAKSYRAKKSEGISENARMKGYSKHRLFSLMSNFIFIYLLVQIVTFPTGRFFEVYGKSGSTVLYVLLDMFGLSRAFGTPMFIGTWWYMSLAIAMIVLFPFLYKSIDRWSWIVIVLLVLIPRMIGLDKSEDVLRWIFPMVFGMCCAMYDWYGKWKIWEKEKCSKVPGFVFGIVQAFLIVALIVARQSSSGHFWVDIIDGLLALIIIYFSLNFVVHIPGVGNILELLGKHSMNMFLTHTLIRTTYFQDFSYGFGNAWLNILIFTIVTVLLSIVIEWIKKLIRFNKITAYIEERI